MKKISRLWLDKQGKPYFYPTTTEVPQGDEFVNKSEIKKIIKEELSSARSEMNDMINDSFGQGYEVGKRDLCLMLINFLDGKEDPWEGVL